MPDSATHLLKTATHLVNLKKSKKKSTFIKNTLGYLFYILCSFQARIALLQNQKIIKKLRTANVNIVMNKLLKDNYANLPIDIPLAPDLHQGLWVGWDSNKLSHHNRKKYTPTHTDIDRQLFVAKYSRCRLGRECKPNT